MRSLIFIALILFLSACENSADVSPVGEGGSGQGGSLARFTIVGNYLYTLGGSELNWYDVQTADAIKLVGSESLESGQETIFPLGNLLFLGSRNGMTIMEIGAGGKPERKASVTHFYACDPVVANDSLSFVTLRVEAECRNENSRNVLQAYDVKNIENPILIEEYPMQTPRGMGLIGQTLFLCEGPFGLKVYDVSEPGAIQLISEVKDIHANDVIVLKDQLLVIGKDNVTQYNYDDLSNLEKLSEILIGA